MNARGNARRVGLGISATLRGAALAVSLTIHAHADQYSDRIAVISQQVAAVRSLPTDSLVATTAWWNAQSHQVSLTTLVQEVQYYINPLVGVGCLELLWRRAGMQSNECRAVFCERTAAISEATATEQLLLLSAWSELYARSPSNAWAFLVDAGVRHASLGDLVVAGVIMNPFEMSLVPATPSSAASTNDNMLGARDHDEWFPLFMSVSNWSSMARGSNASFRFVALSVASAWVASQEVVYVWSNILYDASLQVNALGHSVLIDKVPQQERGPILSNFMVYAKNSCGTNLIAWAVYRDFVENLSADGYWGTFPYTSDPDIPPMTW